MSLRKHIMLIEIKINIKLQSIIYIFQFDNKLLNFAIEHSCIQFKLTKTFIYITGNNCLKKIAYNY